MPNIHSSLACLAAVFCASLCAPAPASADNDGGVRQKLFEMDKASALSGFNAAQKQACTNAFASRYQSQYTISDALKFNEQLSLAAYDRLFWKGKGSLQRGLLFTASVNDSSGAKAGSLVCYYAVTDNHLDFQSAYVLPVQIKTSEIASNVSANPASTDFLRKE
jgi:hypothetical protein